jgi:hypothetical protein
LRGTDLPTICSSFMPVLMVLAPWKRTSSWYQDSASTFRVDEF